MVPTRRRLAAIVALFGLAALAAPVTAQENWPTRPITYVVPFPTGGTTDTLARLIAQRLGQALGTTVVVDNKPGARGNIGSEFVARAAPDGYTILGGTISSQAINVSLYPKLPYDPLKSFAPITLIGSNRNVLVVPAGSPFKSVADILKALKDKPGSLSRVIKAANVKTD
jgi:tripartite-type tricarboxylate transporter receptor subunit TctC